MALKGRVDRLAKRLGADEPRPLTVVLLDAAAGERPTRRERPNSAGLPVLEVACDPDGNLPVLPPLPYKLVRGGDPVDLV